MRSTMWLIDVLHRLGGERRARARPARPSSRAAASSSARGTTRFTSPKRSASLGVERLARRAGTPWPCAARAPTARRAAPRRRPTCAAPGWRSGRRRPRRSGRTCTASIRPAAEHVPCTAAIVGLRKSRMRTSLSKYMTCSWRSLPSGVSRIAAQCSSPARSSFRSWPAREVLALGARARRPGRRRRRRPGRRRRRARRSSAAFCAFAASGRSQRDRRDRPRRPHARRRDGARTSRHVRLRCRRPGAGSRGRPSTRSPMMLRWISLVPAKIDAAW